MTIKTKREILNEIRKALVTVWYVPDRHNFCEHRVMYHSGNPRLWIQIDGKQYEIKLEEAF